MSVMNLEPALSADTYASRIGRTLNSGFVALMISIGHRTSLFDTMAAMAPATSREIAAEGGLTERYVREWLAAMTMARIVRYDLRTNTYFLPVEYAAVLSRSAGRGSLAPAAELVSLLAGVEDLVVAGFHGGGGVMPEAYDRLRALVANEKRQFIDTDYVEALLEFIPVMDLRLAAGATVLDAGCGDGALLLEMARMFPRSSFRGLDLSEAAIEVAQERAGEAGVDNIEFVVGDVTRLEETRAFDLILAFESIHEQGFPRIVLRKIADALRHDGVFLVQEAAASAQLARNDDHPFAPMLYSLSLMYSVPVALAQDGEALGRMWGEERARQMLAEAGFRGLRFETLAADPLRYYCIASK